MTFPANILRQFEDLDLSGVAFGAALGGGNGEPLASVAAVPRIHTVVMAEAQRDELLSLGLVAVDGERQLLRNPNTDFHVVVATWCHYNSNRGSS
jgi:hypothetical protein